MKKEKKIVLKKNKLKKLETNGSIFMFSPLYHQETREKINEIIEVLNELIERS